MYTIKKIVGNDSTNGGGHGAERKGYSRFFFRVKARRRAIAGHRLTQFLSCRFFPLVSHGIST
jgi:hypothetical protein